MKFLSLNHSGKSESPIALLGDAAHTIHPLAGQGVNLGFMDVAELIGEIRRLKAEEGHT